MVNIENIFEKVKDNKIDLKDILDLNLSEDQFDKLVATLKQSEIEIISSNDKEDNNDSHNKSNNKEVSATYLSELRKIPQLSVEEEKILFTKFSKLKNEIKKAKSNNLESVNELEQLASEIREKIIESNLKLAVSVANLYDNKGYSMDLSDLISEANIGLMKAVEGFDVSKGYKFSTYATFCIKNCIIRAVCDQSRTIKLPLYIIDQKNKIRNAEEKLCSILNRTPSSEELSLFLQIPQKKIVDIYRLSQDTLSLDEPVGEEGESSFGDFVPDSVDCVEDAIKEQTIKKFLEDLWEALISYELNSSVTKSFEQKTKIAERKYYILCLRYGLIDGICRTLEEVGNKLKISRQAVSVVERKTLKQLSNNKNIKEYKKLLKSN